MINAIREHNIVSEMDINKCNIGKSYKSIHLFIQQFYLIFTVSDFGLSAEHAASPLKDPIDL